MPNYLYNGIELPALPEWDKETYPYAMIGTAWYPVGYEGRYVLVVSKAVEIVTYNETLQRGETMSFVNCKKFIENNGVWEEYILTADTIPFWTNADMYYNSAQENDLAGTLYLGASEPVPVGGDTFEYVIMPKQDYKAVCDAIRAKTGKTDLIKSGDMASEIESIPTI